VFTGTISLEADISTAIKKAERFKKLEQPMQIIVWGRVLNPGIEVDCLGWWMRPDALPMNDQESNRRKMRDLYWSKLDAYRWKQ
jgi:hypothetical protein